MKSYGSAQSTPRSAKSLYFADGYNVGPLVIRKRLRRDSSTVLRMMSPKEYRYFYLRFSVKATDASTLTIHTLEKVEMVRLRPQQRPRSKTQRTRQSSSLQALEGPFITAPRSSSAPRKQPTCSFGRKRVWGGVFSRPHNTTQNLHSPTCLMSLFSTRARTTSGEDIHLPKRRCEPCPMEGLSLAKIFLLFPSQNL